MTFLIHPACLLILPLDALLVLRYVLVQDRYDPTLDTHRQIGAISPLAPRPSTQSCAYVCFVQVLVIAARCSLYAVKFARQCLVVFCLCLGECWGY